MFVKPTDYLLTVPWSLWPLVCYWGIISTGKISTALLKNMARKSRNRHVLILSWPALSILRRWNFSVGSLSRARYVRARGGLFTSSCPSGGESFAVHISLHKSSGIINSHSECPVNDRQIRGLSSMLNTNLTGASPQRLLHLPIFCTYSARTTDAQQA
jgi:hypothetical protein